MFTSRPELREQVDEVPIMYGEGTGPAPGIGDDPRELKRRGTTMAGRESWRDLHEEKGRMPGPADYAPPAGAAW